jgi:hypothetical protein
MKTILGIAFHPPTPTPQKKLVLTTHLLLLSIFQKHIINNIHNIHNNHNNEHDMLQGLKRKDGVFVRTVKVKLLKLSNG